MKERRAGFTLLIFLVAIHLAFLLPQSSKSIDLRQNYAPTVCPDGINKARATILLPSKSLTSRPLDKPQYKFVKSAQGSLALTRGALIVSGDRRNTIALQSLSGKWTAATTCAMGQKIQWFVGGSSSVTSRGKLLLLNSGLSDATVAVTTFSENGPLPTSTYTVKASSQKSVTLDSLDPGAARLALKVEILSGRVTPYLLDERVKGLKNLGGDFVNPISTPQNKIVIAGIPTKFGAKSKVTHTLRLMTTAKVDASVSVEIVSTSGEYVPVELSDISLNSQEVRDISLTGIDFGKSSFALRLTGTAPIIAAVKSEVKKGSLSDFLWSTPSENFGVLSYNFYGLEPVMTFVGDRIWVNIEWKDSRGKSHKKTLSGQSIVNWKAQPNIRALTITNRTASLGAMAWQSADGVAFLPFTQGSEVESATRPYIDISVIQPRS